MENIEIPVLLLTGYLGSGKTTLLNRILSNSKGIKFAVIVNDIGEVNIDATLIEQGGVVGKKDDSLVALQNGCICCTLKMDLVEQLREIVAMKRFDYIVIEASGICEPEPIAQTICSIPTLGPHYTKDGVPVLDCIATVVDVLRMKDEFECGRFLTRSNIDEDDIENLVIQQIEFCNIIVLNKVSEVSAEDLGRVRDIITTLQPKARLIECDYCDFDLDRIIGTGAFDYGNVAASPAWIRGVEAPIQDFDDDDDDDESEDHHHHHHHDHEGGEVEEYGIGTYVYAERRPLDINKFDNFVAKHWPDGVIRAKGVCYFEDQFDKCYLFEQAGKQISLKSVGNWYATMPKDELADAMLQDPILARDWDPFYGDRVQRLVFIGQHLDKHSIKEALDACLA